MKTIGIVCEGDRDFDMIQRVIGCFCEEEYHALFLQPNPEFGTDNGNGWKGVIRWCQKNASTLYQYMNSITPAIDLLIVHMDADVARCEKEIYCRYVAADCGCQDIEDYLNCSMAKKESCPQELPPNTVCDGTVNNLVEYLKNLLRDILGKDERIRTIITIPCDATDSWIIAAFDDDQDVELIHDPWNKISLKKYYHNIRVHRDQKKKVIYNKMIDTVIEKWDTVKSKCPQAFQFENDVIQQL